MTISSTTNRVQITSGSSITITNLEIQNEDQVLVTKTDSSGVESTLVKTTDYTVNSTLDTVTLNVALATSEKATATLNVDNTQSTRYRNTGPLNSETVENALDKLTLIHKQNSETSDRALKQSISDTTTLGELPDLSSSGDKYLKRNSGNTGWEVINIANTTAIEMPVSVANGGTGATTAPAALTALGGIGAATSDTLTNKTLTEAKIADSGFLADANGNELLTCGTTASAVNNLKVSNAATGGGPIIEAVGDDTNVAIEFQSKGTGSYKFLGTSSGSASLKLYEDTDNGTGYVGFKAPSSVTSSVSLTLPNGDGSNGQVLATDGSGTLSWTSPGGSGTINDSNGNELIEEGATASAVNHIKVTNATTGNTATIASAGDDTNVDLTVDTKGTGTLYLGSSDSSAVNVQTDMHLENDFVGFGTTSLSKGQVEIKRNFTESATREAILYINRTSAVAGGSGYDEVGILVDHSESYNSAGDVYGVKINASHASSGLAYGVYSDTTGATGNYSTAGHFKINHPDVNGPQIHYGVTIEGTVAGSNSNGYLYGLNMSMPNYVNAYAVTIDDLYSTAASKSLQIFKRASTTVGSISTTLSATAYNTSSDYRLKENVTELESAIDDVKAIKVKNFSFKQDPGRYVNGFIAHELAEVVPEAVTGDKDAVDAAGNPVYQGVDQSKLVPILVRALQEALIQVESLEGKLAAQEVLINNLLLRVDALEK